MKQLLARVTIHEKAEHGQADAVPSAVVTTDERTAIMEAELRAVSKRLKSLDEYVARLTAHQRVLVEEGDRKRAEGKKHNAALICLARCRCDVLYAMLKNKTIDQTSSAAAVLTETIGKPHAKTNGTQVQPHR